jgi:hypothetical protein
MRRWLVLAPMAENPPGLMRERSPWGEARANCATGANPSEYPGQTAGSAQAGFWAREMPESNT